MSESRSTSKSHDSFNGNIIEKPVCYIFEDEDAENNRNYIQFYNHLQSWLLTTNNSNMNEKDLQLGFY